VHRERERERESVCLRPTAHRITVLTIQVKGFIAKRKGGRSRAERVERAEAPQPSNRAEMTLLSRTTSGSKRRSMNLTHQRTLQKGRNSHSSVNSCTSEDKTSETSVSVILNSAVWQWASVNCS